MGRPWPAPGEALWLPEDRAWVYALMEVEAEACPDCGRPWDEVSAPEAEYAYRGEIGRCHACHAGHRAVTQHEQAGGDLRALHVRVVPAD